MENKIEREVIKKYSKDYYLKNKDRISQKRKKYYKENKEKIKKQKKEYYKKNKKCIIERITKYQQTNKELHTKYIREWRKKNPEKVREINKRIRLKENLKNSRARDLANYHIKIPKGQLCEMCFKQPAVLRHHWNYDFPLEVKFLDAWCHRLLESWKNKQKKLFKQNNLIKLQGGEIK